MVNKITEYAGTLRITNPETLQRWKDSGKFSQLIKDGYIFAKGCGRFRTEICKCSSCRRLNSVIK